MALRAQNTKLVIVSEPTIARRKHLSDWAHVVLNPREENVGDRCRELTDGMVLIWFSIVLVYSQAW